MLRISLILVLIIAPSLGAQQLPRQSPRVSSYRMSVELDPRERTVTGSQVITWRNTSSAPTSELRFHLYLNAFRDPQSTLMVESDSSFIEQWREDEFGSIEVHTLELEIEGGQVALESRHVSPDDGNPDDRTVLLVALPSPVDPGVSITLHTTFTSFLPKAYRRTGWIPGNGFFCMHWFPKLGVLEQVGDQAIWNCHQFHSNTEFFADFSTYDVEITVPEGYQVGASGLLQEETLAAGKKRLRFLAEDVHDFAFVADPDFRRYQETYDGFTAANDPSGVAQAVAERMQQPISQFNLPRTEIILLLNPQHDSEEQVRRHMDAVKLALEFYGLRYGPYPYRTITVVDPGSDIEGRGLGGGMEYPTLITCGTPLYPHPRQQRPEGVTVHEFGHQYWYGLSANNEFEESWLDEGINSYSEGRAQWLRYFAGRPTELRSVRTSSYGLLTLGSTAHDFVSSSLSSAELPIKLLPEAWRDQLAKVNLTGTFMPQLPPLELLYAQPLASSFKEAYFQDGWNDRNSALSADNPDPLVKNGWQYIGRASYSVNSYTRPATILRTLERIVGRDEWWTFMRRFYAQARFDHPTTEAFVTLLEAECGREPAEFFRNISGAGAILDYGIHSISPASGKGPTKTVTVRRYGSVKAEIKVRFRFVGLDQPVVRNIPASEASPWVEFSFTVDDNGKPYGDLLEVWVDPPEGSPGSGEAFEEACEPAGVYLIDNNLLNNAWRSESDPRPVLYRSIRLLLQTQSRLTFAGIIG